MLWGLFLEVVPERIRPFLGLFPESRNSGKKPKNGQKNDKNLGCTVPSKHFWPVSGHKWLTRDGNPRFADTLPNDFSVELKKSCFGPESGILG